MEENQEPINENENREEVQDEQKVEKDIFARKEEKINNTKEKLSELLEKMKEQPEEKETVKKKILRIQIKRLRNVLEKQMAKFNIEFDAHQLENTEYEAFQMDCEAIQEKIDSLRDREDELYAQLARYTKTESFRGEKDRRVATEVQKLAPKGQRGKTRDLRSKPRVSKVAETRKKIDEVQSQISKLEEELDKRISEYKEHKKDRKIETKQNVAGALEEIEEKATNRNKYDKEELALANPSVWSIIKNKLREVKDKFTQWKTKRQENRATIRAHQDAENVTAVEDLINTKTAGEKFRSGLHVNVPGVQQEVAKNVEGYMAEQNKENETAKKDKEETEIGE